MGVHKINESLEVRIIQDEVARSPREGCDYLGSMVCWHSRYTLGDSHSFKSPEEFKKWWKNKGVGLPLYVYEHSGMTMSTKPFASAWDSSQRGFIYATNEKIREQFNVKRVSQKLKKKVIECLEAEVKTYDMYLTGEVYGYQIIRYKKCEHCNNVEEEEGDSCWGFYGDDIMTNGMMDHFSEEVRLGILSNLMEKKL